MKKRGFTLIELLAVIVVLAIIALIATPIVMNVIKKANEGAAERSADNYIKAVETLIATEKLDGTPLVDGTYTIESDGTLKGNGKTYTVEVSGTKPVGGTVVITNGQVAKADTTIDYTDYTVKYSSGKAEASEKGTKKLMTLADCDYVNGTKAEGEVGAKYTCNFGDKDRTFYVLEIGTDPITNSTLKSNEVALILEGNFDMTTQTWCLSGNDNSCAADGLSVKLNDIVENTWTKLNRTQIGIPSMEQIMVADGQAEDAYLGWATINHGWLIDYPDVEGFREEKGPVFGYWTSTPDVSDSTDAWHTYCLGATGKWNVDHDNGYGVRPVITLSI